MSIKLNKQEIKNLCKYFFKCGQEQQNPEMFDSVFETDYTTRLKIKKIEFVKKQKAEVKK